MEGVISCPECGSAKLRRNGKGRSGRRRWLCTGCGKSFMVDPFGIKPEIRMIADRMLEAEIPLPVISSVLAGFVSRRWVYKRSVDKRNQ